MKTNQVNPLTDNQANSTENSIRTKSGASSYVTDRGLDIIYQQVY